MKSTPSQFLSQRVAEMPPSATLAMSALSASLQKQGLDILNLSAGEPDFPTPSLIIEAVQKDLASGKYFKYPPVAGYPELREAIAHKMQQENHLNVQPDQVIVSTGAKQSITNALCALLNPGDEVIIFSPHWVTYPALVRLMGGVPVFAIGEAKNNYKIKPEDLEKAISARTKAILFSSPSNPTGASFSREELQDLVKILLRHPKVVAISDEIYEYISFQGTHTSIGSFKEIADRTLTINGFSKAFAMTGWRLGYLAAPPSLAKACEKIQGQMTSGANTLAQRAGIAALKYGKKVYLPMVKAFQERRDLAIESLEEIEGLRVPKPEGAFYLFPDFSAYLGKRYRDHVVDTVEDLSKYLLKEVQVATVHGQAFGCPHALRISFATSETVLKDAIARIKQALANLA
ncbi:MAG: pyridoxal phosphate-dependent aminotransferase [Cytophagales bacterium]|nr:pyridoxal phosphate-dependent aminotransferase [Cytophagales bacterium]